jgi:hypothetical protein
LKRWNTPSLQQLYHVALAEHKWKEAPTCLADRARTDQPIQPHAQTVPSSCLPANMPDSALAVYAISALAIGARPAQGVDRVTVQLDRGVGEDVHAR